ncbi:MAG TPA: class I SAM-dependent rRNA methyltransferase [Verrucomicrobiae bacterium]|nr:class I SAM-dependent rRNA methyltransferase [Verrucomicrobiae bacterium]
MLHIYLKKGRERPILAGHPWIFSGAIEKSEADSAADSVAEVLDFHGRFLARGLYNPKSQIRVRVLTWEKDAIDAAFFSRRIAAAVALRERLVAPFTNAYRVINGEGDFLPGLIVDRYGDYLVCEFFTAGIDALKSHVIEALAAELKPKGVYERSEGGVRDEEGLAPSVGVVYGDEPPDLIEIEENAHRFLVDIRTGQKTGFFLDQRDNRALIASLAPEMTILNCFAYTGGFSVYALKAGAKRVISLDSSRPALDLARRNLELNGLTVEESDLIRGDAFSYLKNFNQKIDLLVLDPPSLAHRRGDVEAAAGGYKFLNLHGLKLLPRGGLLLTFCCSQHVAVDLFQKIVFGAAVDARRKVQLLKRLGPAPDHPVSLHHPEGEYLKGLFLRVLE